MNYLRAICTAFCSVSATTHHLALEGKEAAALRGSTVSLAILGTLSWSARLVLQLVPSVLAKALEASGSEHPVSFWLRACLRLVPDCCQGKSERLVHAPVVSLVLHFIVINAKVVPDFMESYI